MQNLENKNLHIMSIKYTYLKHHIFSGLSIIVDATTGTFCGGADNKKSEKLEVAELFIAALHKIVSMLGKQEPFSPKKGRPNYALLDSTIVSVMKHINNIPEDFATRFDNLINSEDYKNIFAPGQGTMSTKAVNDRLMKAEQVLCL